MIFMRCYYVCVLYIFPGLKSIVQYKGNLVFQIFLPGPKGLINQRWHSAIILRLRVWEVLAAPRGSRGAAPRRFWIFAISSLHEWLFLNVLISNLQQKRYLLLTAFIKDFDWPVAVLTANVTSTKFTLRIFLWNRRYNPFHKSIRHEKASSPKNIFYTALYL